MYVQGCISTADCMCVNSSSMLEILCYDANDTHLEVFSYNCAKFICNNVTVNNNAQILEINVTNCNTDLSTNTSTAMSCELYCDNIGSNVSTRLYASESILTSDSFDITGMWKLC